ncbi:ribosome hibernation-promoting factor, HPF/YfiA family [Caldinitratiruptor microaerophilus]|uniref:Ribosome hibernation promoting factor n=1 Tax=Caldinitratiruptor microaerophilus TaxID=671077 RepID=A0AA35CQ01_9FIRM|nr:ribosome-associated translation inhibitor RaiA [Caldinitratiruptor microaerophilus]BDG61720.1 ribosomal subunit interface protein [Caldinitratiruptor microaerophilus]
MDVAVYGRNIEVTAALRDYVTKKLSKLDKLITAPQGAKVAMSVERGRHIVEVTIPVKEGFLLRGEEASDSMYASIDLVLEKLEKQVKRYKARWDRKRAEPSADLAAMAGAEAGPAGAEAAGDEWASPDEDRIVRVKRFAMKPQTVAEAIMQMNLLGHDFYVFANAETDRFSVVYRRKDGNYGLIEPER